MWLPEPWLAQFISTVRTRFTQPPLVLQARSTLPHGVLTGSGDEVSTQTEAPVVHEVIPETQAFGFVAQLIPAVHDTQRPYWQTKFVPQVVPSGRFVVGLQTGLPVAQFVTPFAHG